MCSNCHIGFHLKVCPDIHGKGNLSHRGGLDRYQISISSRAQIVINIEKLTSIWLDRWAVCSWWSLWICVVIVVWCGISFSSRSSLSSKRRLLNSLESIMLRGYKQLAKKVLRVIFSRHTWSVATIKSAKASINLVWVNWGLDWVCDGLSPWKTLIACWASFAVMVMSSRLHSASHSFIWLLYKCLRSVVVDVLPP